MPESHVSEDATASHTGARSPMVVVTMGDEAPADGMQVLANISRPPRQLVVLGDIEKALAAYPDETLVVVLASPARSLLSALREGKMPSLALARWKEQATNQVRILRKVRRRIIAFDSGALSANPHRCAEILASRLHIPFDSAVAESNPPQAVADSPSLALVVALLFQCDPDARRLADEIEATLSFSSTVCEINVEQIDLVVATFQAQTRELDALRVERDLLRDDLVQMQEQLERAETERGLQLAANEAKDRRLATLTGKHLMRESTLGATILQYGALTEARGAEIEALKAREDALGAAVLQYGALTEARGAEIETLKAQMDTLAPTAKQLMRESALGVAILQYGVLTETRRAEIAALQAQVDALGAAVLQYGALAEARGAEIAVVKGQMDALAPAANQSSSEQSAKTTVQPEAQAQETSKSTREETNGDCKTAAGRSSKAKRSPSRRRFSLGKA